MKATPEQQEPKIIRAIITPTSRDIFAPLPRVIVTLDSGEEEELFTYYPDEISFSPGEFIGLTTDEGRRLKCQKDLQYLRS